MRGPRFLFLLFFSFTLFATLPALAQSTEADISARLVGKPLFLRGFWAEDKLKFDAAGQPEGKVTVTSFTLSGIRLDSVNIHGGKLRLHGLREGLEFHDNGDMERVPLHTGKPRDPKPEKVEIEIDGHGSSDFGPALDAIFADKLVDLVPALPGFWRRYAHVALMGHDGEASRPETTPDVKTREEAVRERGTMHVAGTVKPPKVMHKVDPVFAEAARRMRYSGKVQVYCWVDSLGMPSHISVARAAGLGLDEQAVNAVSQYRFFPAMRDGQPVTVDLYIEVNFQIY